MQKITTEHIDFSKPAQEVFFSPNGYQEKCPGWAVGKIKLPVTLHSNFFFLVCDRAGEYHWVPRNNISIPLRESQEITFFQASQKASWFGFVDNGSEDKNIIALTGELTLDGITYAVFQMSGRFVSDDECFSFSINRTEDDRFLWRNADRTGLTDSFINAWDNMPAFVTNPDGYEESPSFTNDLPLWASFSER